MTIHHDPSSLLVTGDISEKRNPRTTAREIQHGRTQLLMDYCTENPCASTDTLRLRLAQVQLCANNQEDFYASSGLHKLKYCNQHTLCLPCAVHHEVELTKERKYLYGVTPTFLSPAANRPK